MASNPPAACCYQGVKHEGQPTGSFSMLNEFDIYTSYPANKSVDYAVLLLTDIIDHRFTNAQLIADQFAANGWLLRHDGRSVQWRPCPAQPASRLRYARMKEEKIGAVGYCFGAKYVVRHLQPMENDNKKVQINFGYLAHPSFVMADELKAISGPLAIAAAENDHIFSAAKRHESEEILKMLGLPYQMNLYGGVEHGFAVRGDLNKRSVQFAKESAFLQAVQWLKEHL